MFRCRLRDAAPAIAEVTAAHAGRASRWSLVGASTPSDLPDHLARAGYALTNTHRGVTLAVDAWTRVDTGHTVRQVVDLAGLEDLYAVADAAFGRQNRPDDATMVDEVAECAPGSRVQRFVVYDGDRPVCGGGLNVYPDLGLGFLWAGGTVPDARGRGAYRTLLQARIDLARARGLTRVGLYARSTTSLPICQRLGFATHGPMWTFDRR